MSSCPTWLVENVTSTTVELDFTSSGQGRRSATVVEAAGVRLFNAIELIEVESEATQVQLCESCGFPGCSPGGWVSMRRVGDRGGWVPAWNKMEDDARARTEYGPPAFFRSRGAPLFDPACWERLRALHENLPVVGELPRIRSRELVRLCQWSAPGQVLGEYPWAPHLRRDLVIAVTNGDLTTEADRIDRWVRDHYRADRPMDVLPEQMAMSPLELWLDLPGTPSWSCFARVEDDLCFRIGAIGLVREGTGLRG